MELYKNEIPENFYNMGFCEKCNKLIIPTIGKTFFTKKMIIIFTTFFAYIITIIIKFRITFKIYISFYFFSIY